MNCRKCGCEILEGTERCPMCDTKQRGAKRKPKINSAEMLMESGEQRRSSNNALIVIISILVTSAVVAIGFVLFNAADFDNNEDSHTQEQETDDQYFFLNQMNMHNISIQGSIYVTEDSIYVMSFGGVITVFDHDFNEEAVIRLRDEWALIGRFYVTDDSIYYTTGFDEGYLYRYDRETSENQQLASNVFNKTIVGDQVFHLSAEWDMSNLYVFDKETGETSVVFEGDVWEFLINTLDNTIIFTDGGSLYRIDFDGDNFEQLNSDHTRGFAFDGHTLIWTTLSYDVYMMDINTGEEINVTQEFDPFKMLLTEDYFVFMEWNDGGDLYIVNRSSNHSQQVASDVLSFAVVGEYIVYGVGESFNIYVMDFAGNSRVLIED